MVYYNAQSQHDAGELFFWENQSSTICSTRLMMLDTFQRNDASAIIHIAVKYGEIMTTTIHGIHLRWFNVTTYYSCVKLDDHSQAGWKIPETDWNQQTHNVPPPFS